MKIILTDLDETLLHSDKTISDYTKDVLSQCRAYGILVGFCTSRGMAGIRDYIKQIQPDIVICNGGACIYYNDELVHSATFTTEETRKILAKAYEVCGESSEITLDTLEHIYWNRGKDETVKYVDNAIFDDFSNFAQPAMKICVQTDDPEKAKMIAQCVTSCDYLPFSDIPWYKFSSGIATKEYAVKVLSEKLKVSLDEIIAFGDDFNDIGMLKLCGKGIAMENAILQVKEVADDITLSNNEDGVAKYLQLHGIITT